MQAVRFILFLLLSLGNVSSELYHVTPSLNDPCPSTSDFCLTLSQFVNSSDVYISFNTTLIFLFGNHSLDLKLTVDNVNTFSMFSNSVSTSDKVRIICNDHGMFQFDNISIVHISALTFHGCIRHRVISVNYFVLEDIDFMHTAALELVKTTARLVKNSFRFNVANKLI